MATVNVVFTRESEDGRRWLEGVQIVGQTVQLYEAQFRKVLDDWASSHVSRLIGFRVVEAQESYAGLLGPNYEWFTLFMDDAVVEAADAADAPQGVAITLPPKPEDDTLEEARCLVLSTAHLSAEDNSRLSRMAGAQLDRMSRVGDRPWLLSTQRGYIIPYVSPADAVESGGVFGNDHLPEHELESDLPSLRALLGFARQRGFNMLHLDGDASTTEGLPRYEW